MNWREDKLMILGIVSVCLFVLLLIGITIHHDIKYVCLKGHYEEQTYFDPSLKMVMTHDVWVCEEEMLREEYNKLKK